MLTNVFLNDLDYADRGHQSNKRSPSMESFISKVVLDLELLGTEQKNVAVAPNTMEGPNGLSMPQSERETPKVDSQYERPPANTSVKLGAAAIGPLPHMPIQLGSTVIPEELMAQIPSGVILPPIMPFASSPFPRSGAVEFGENAVNLAVDEKRQAAIRLLQTGNN